MGVFGGLGKAESGSRQTWPKPGFRGLVRLGKLIYKAKTQKKGDKALIVEFEIVTNLSADTVTDAVGCKRSWYQKMNVEATALGAVKPFVQGAMGIPDSNVEAKTALFLEDDQGNSPASAIMDEAIGPKQILTGKLLFLECVAGTIHNGQDPFTFYNWSAAPAEAQKAA